MMSSIFLSHNKGDNRFARKLAKELSAFGSKVWLDEAEMKPGDSLIEKIEHGILKSRFLGVILSPRSVTSRWVQKELRAALTMEIDNKRIKVIPILLKNCEIPLFLREKKYVDFRNTRDFKKSLEGLSDALRPRGFRKRLLNAVRGAIAAEIAAYRALPK